MIAADVAKARAQLNEYEQDYLRLQSAVVTQELRLRNLLNLSPTGGGGKLLPVTEPTTARVQTTPNESYLVAIDNRPEVVRQRLNVSIRRLEVLVADNQRKPDLDFTALYRMNGLGEDLGDALDQMVECRIHRRRIGSDSDDADRIASKKSRSTGSPISTRSRSPPAGTGNVFCLA